MHLSPFLSEYFVELYIFTGENFELFIERHKPVVFTNENVDPYVCGHQAPRCATKVSQVYEIAGVPMAANGEKCTNFAECNEAKHGELLEWKYNYLFKRIITK